MSVRTYNPSVRVGNWNEDIQLEEDTLKDFLERRDRGELLIQRSAQRAQTVLHPMEVSVSKDGKVHFGSTIILVNPALEGISRGNTILCADGEILTASTSVEPSARSALTIASVDGSPPGSTLKYGQSFYLCNMQGAFLYSDRAGFGSCAKKSRHNKVQFNQDPGHLCEWVIKAFNPQYRLEMEEMDVPANEKIILSHVKTNQNLCLEKDHLVATSFGREYEVSACTKLNSHKAEEDGNHWMIMMKVPGDTTMPMSPPANN